MLGRESAGGLDSVEDGHVQLEQDHVGVMLGYQVEGLLAVGSGRGDVDAEGVGEHVVDLAGNTRPFLQHAARRCSARSCSICVTSAADCSACRR
jgi:hypothetical protein